MGHAVYARLSRGGAYRSIEPARVGTIRAFCIPCLNRAVLPPLLSTQIQLQCHYLPVYLR